jgi:hypothetical protein
MNTDRITAATISKESYYNVCRIADATRYANPAAAMRATGGCVDVTKDGHGNITSAEWVPASARTYFPVR